MSSRLLVSAVLSLVLAVHAFALEYPVVYVAVPRVPDVKPRLQDVDLQTGMDVGSHLRIVQPDGTDRVLWQPGQNGGVMDPTVSIDGTKVFFAYTDDAREVPFKFEAAINLYELTLGSGAIRQLTFSTEPGDYNTGPCEVPGGRLIFTSSRNRINPANQTDNSSVRRGNEHPVMQLFALKLSDPANTVEQVGFLNLRGALHPTLLTDGRVMWSSHENHGIRRKDLWGLWVSYPDGRKWEPLWSAFGSVDTNLSSLHFQSQSANGRVQLVYYYPTKSSGHGNLLDFPLGSGFGSPTKTQNPRLADSHVVLQFPFQPNGARSLTPWASSKDSGLNGVCYPSGAPDGVLVSSADLSPDRGSQRQIRECGIYLIKNAEPAATKAALVKIIDSPSYYEVQPRALLPWRAIYGSDPPDHPWLPGSKANGQTLDYGFVGTSGVYQRESKQTLNGFLDRDWVQGGDTCEFANADIDRVRIVYQAPTPRGYKPATHWDTTGVERMGVLGDIPLRKFNADGTPVMDSANNPDTSFLAKIPADKSWTLQLLDRDGRVLTHSMTWHQVRPGETRTDCRGCHAHHKPGLEFGGTAASKDSAVDLTGSLRFVEWFRDVKPVLQQHCGECHTGATPEAGFTIDDNLRAHANVVAFRSTQSKLMDAVLGHVEGMDRMPKGKPPLSAVDIRTLATWIDLGAPVDKGKYWDGLPPEGEVEPTPDPDEVERLRLQGIVDRALGVLDEQNATLQRLNEMIDESMQILGEK